MNVENPLISDFYRFGHLQKLQDKIQKTIQQLGNSEEDYLKGRMKQGLVLGIETVINKIPETELNKRAIDQMIMRPWQGRNFSDRVWKNKRLLANQLNDKLRNGIIQGKSPFQIANDLSERMQVGRYQAQRLVRTEYMHVLNQGQIEGYKAKGYTKLKWHASKDERTCEICGEHHGNEYDIDEAPHLPAHPGCRCTFIPVIDVESAAEELKQARDRLNNIIKDDKMIARKGHFIQSGAKNYFRNDFADAFKTKEEIRKEKYAFRQYDAIKNSNQDISKRKILNNIGKFGSMSHFTFEDVNIAFNHVFNDYHQLHNGLSLFEPDYDMAQSWTRLINGNIKEEDLILIQHERLEHDLMYISDNLNYIDAHNMTNEKFNYQLALERSKNNVDI